MCQTLFGLDTLAGTLVSTDDFTAGRSTVTVDVKQSVFTFNHSSFVKCQHKSPVFFTLPSFTSYKREAHFHLGTMLKVHIAQFLLYCLAVLKH